MKMNDKTRNYGRFFSAFRTVRVHGDREECRRQLVLQYTAGRSDSLRDMTDREYHELCEAVEGMNGMRDELKRRRSTVLKLMQELGVDTSDWSAVNEFCLSPRIAGRPFGRLDAEELKELAVRLRTIKRKGWRREAPAQYGDTVGLTLAMRLAMAGAKALN